MISNTSPIIYFTKINKLDLLRRLYGSIIITKEFEEELLFNNKPDFELIKRAIEENLFTIKSPSSNLDLSLGKGENSWKVGTLPHEVVSEVLASTRKTFIGNGKEYSKFEATAEY